MTVTFEQVTAWAASGESDALEFKKSTAEKDRACRTLCAFANGQGGRVLFGVAPAGKAVGQTVNDRTLEELAQEFQGFEPPLFPAVERVAAAHGLEVLVVSVAHSARVPVAFRRGLRAGAEYHAGDAARNVSALVAGRVARHRTLGEPARRGLGCGAAGCARDGVDAGGVHPPWPHGRPRHARAAGDPARAGAAGAGRAPVARGGGAVLQGRDAAAGFSAVAAQGGALQGCNARRVSGQPAVSRQRLRADAQGGALPARIVAGGGAHRAGPDGA